MESFLKKYQELRETIDAKVVALEKTHKKHMLCKAGCSMCCREYAILPIEFEFVKTAIKKMDKVEFNPNFTNDECPFLINHTCSIYNARPIICRTHGLPLLFMGEDDWELSACELNFTKVKEDYFEVENTFPQDTFNSQLYVLNQSFLKAKNRSKGVNNPQLISIQELTKEI